VARVTIQSNLSFAGAPARVPRVCAPFTNFYNSLFQWKRVKKNFFVGYFDHNQFVGLFFHFYCFAP
jgi:hypothetical protein